MNIICEFTTKFILTHYNKLKNCDETLSCDNITYLKESIIKNSIKDTSDKIFSYEFGNLELKKLDK